MLNQLADLSQCDQLLEGLLLVLAGVAGDRDDEALFGQQQWLRTDQNSIANPLLSDQNVVRP